MCQSNFWFSMAMAAGAVFFSASYFSPAITMMQNSVDK
jgi:hypothetical protein